MYYWPFAAEHDTAVAVKPFYGDAPADVHSHTYSELCIILKGFCVHSYRGAELILVPGDAFMIPSREAHAYSWMADMSVINVHFYEDKIRPESRALFDRITRWLDIMPEKAGNIGIRRQGIVHFGSAETKEIADIMMKMHEEDTEKPLGETMKLAYLDLLLCMFLRKQMGQSAGENSDGESERTYNIVTRAVSMIEENMTRGISADEIAAELNISTSYFRKLFRDVTGLPPNDYMNRLRIIRSIDYLNDGERNYSVGEIAEAVGVCDANYYSRMFKKYMGSSPQNYKKKIKLC